MSLFIPDEDLSGNVLICGFFLVGIEKVKVRRAMATSLQKSALKIIMIVNRDKDHIPPITTTDQNPFPYHITVGGRGAGNSSPRMGIF